MGLEILLIVVIFYVTRAMKVRRLVKALLLTGYFVAVILVWSITWQIPYRPNALLIDSISLGLPFAFWLFCLLLIKFLTKKSHKNT